MVWQEENRLGRIKIYLFFYFFEGRKRKEEEMFFCSFGVSDSDEVVILANWDALGASDPN